MDYKDLRVDVNTQSRRSSTDESTQSNSSNEHPIYVTFQSPVSPTANAILEQQLKNRTQNRLSPKSKSREIKKAMEAWNTSWLNFNPSLLEDMCAEIEIPAQQVRTIASSPKTKHKREGSFSPLGSDEPSE
jgi:hypothetical protein